jgi:subtilisin family serine protease
MPSTFSPIRPLALSLSAALLLAACQNNAIAPLAQTPQSGAALQAQSQNSRLSNRILVGYKGALTPERIKQLESRHQLRFVKNLARVGVAVFQGNPQQISTLAQDTSISFFGPDQAPRRIVGEPQFVDAPRSRSGDPLLDKQWSLKAVDAEAAWKVSKGNNVVVAVVDTGVDLNHPDLKANLVNGYNAEEPGTPPQDGHYHGTHVAGIIAAVQNNGEGITGIAPQAKIMPVRTISNGGVAEVVDGITWAADNGAKVINLSLGWDYPNASVEETIQRAVKYALDKNVVICAALSNSSSFNPRSTPDNLAGKAGFEGVIGVGNVDLNDRRQGAYGNWKSVSSPGTQIMSTLPDGKYGNLTGTSMATPMVAGIAALMISQNPGLRNADVRKKMMDSAKDLGTPGFDDQFGAGRINAAAVLSQLRLR